MFLVVFGCFWLFLVLVIRQYSRITNPETPAGLVLATLARDPQSPDDPDEVPDMHQHVDDVARG